MKIIVEGREYDSETVLGFSLIKMMGGLWLFSSSVAASSGFISSPLIDMGGNTFRTATESEIQAARQKAGGWLDR